MIPGVAWCRRLLVAETGEPARNLEEARPLGGIMRRTVLKLQACEAPVAEIEKLTEHSFPESVVQVLNEKTKMVHLFNGGGDGGRVTAACGCWKCGSPDEPGRFSEFAKSALRWSPSRSPFSFCRQCYSARVVGRLGGRIL